MPPISIGADIVETNTFNSSVSRMITAWKHSANSTTRARAWRYTAADGPSARPTPRFVAGVLGHQPHCLDLAGRQPRRVSKRHVR